MLAHCSEISLESQKALSGTTEKCNPCAFSIAYVFAKYEKHVEMALETVFQEISEKNAEVLLKAKKEVESNTKILTPNESLKLKIPL